MKKGMKSTSTKEAASAVRQARGRACEEGRRGKSRFRPRQPRLSRSRQGPRGSSARSRFKLLIEGKEQWQPLKSSPKAKVVPAVVKAAKADAIARAAAVDKRDDKEGGDREGSELVERLVAINRVAKVVKVVAVSASQLSLSSATAAARSAQAQVKPAKCRKPSKATDQAKRRMVRVRCAMAAPSTMISKPASAPAACVCAQLSYDAGIIAGGPLRAVFEVLGIQDVVAEVARLDEPLQHGRAALEAFKKMESPAVWPPRSPRERNPRPQGAMREKSDE